MKTKLIAAILCGVIFFGTLGQACAGVSVSFNLFFNNLQPYGTWINVPSYGQVWYPSSVGVGWQPYSRGHWVWTAQGWMWISSEPWGWATYHYGRWVYAEDYGWVWVPGAVWAPAWVSWYVGPSYVGWAPLPPVGYGYVAFRPSYCVFVPTHFFLSVNLWNHYAAPSLSVSIFGGARAWGNVSVVGNAVYNRGPGVGLVQHWTGGPVHQYRLVDANQAGQNRLQGNRALVFRPSVTPGSGFHTPMLNDEANRGIVRVGNRQFNVPRSGRPGNFQRPAFAQGRRNALSRPAPAMQNRSPQFGSQRPFHPSAPAQRPAYHAAPQSRSYHAPAPHYSSHGPSHAPHPSSHGGSHGGSHGDSHHH